MFDSIGRIKQTSPRSTSRAGVFFKQAELKNLPDPIQTKLIWYSLQSLFIVSSGHQSELKQVQE